MYEKGYYVFQDMDKAIRYYEEAGKLSTTSYGPFEAARLKIAMKKADSTASWQLIRNAAAAGNERARVYNIDLTRSVVNFNSNGLMGTIKPVVDFYPYSPILFKRDHEFPMRFQVNYQNNSGSNIQVFPTKVWNIPHDLYAPSSPKAQVLRNTKHISYQRRSVLCLETCPLHFGREIRIILSEQFLL